MEYRGDKMIFEVFRYSVLLFWSGLSVVMVMNNITYGNKDINSNWYIPFIWKILGLDDKS